jgi:hypothetical protein
MNSATTTITILFPQKCVLFITGFTVDLSENHNERTWFIRAQKHSYDASLFSYFTIYKK